MIFYPIPQAFLNAKIIMTINNQQMTPYKGIHHDKYIDKTDHYRHYSRQH